MKAEIPEFLLEISERMNTDENRATAHPLWQVRCQRKYPTEHGYNDVGFTIDSLGKELFSTTHTCYEELKSDLYCYLLENHPEFLEGWLNDTGWRDSYNTDKECFCDGWDTGYGQLPECLRITYYQEIEEVISTHLTKADAEWFIERRQHNYPKLYTYVESAYWSPQLRELQDWIKSLTGDNSNSL